jgi:hypothetical protein
MCRILCLETAALPRPSGSGKFLRRNLYGGNNKALTDAEARTLLGVASLDEARNQSVATRQKRSNRILPEMVERTSSESDKIDFLYFI